jgi:hypothetical protein
LKRQLRCILDQQNTFMFRNQIEQSADQRGLSPSQWVR